jgi:FkbM family methyltransferase
MTFRDLVWDLRFKLQRGNPHHGPTEGEFSMGEVEKDPTSPLNHVDFDFGGRKHRFCFPPELREEAPLALRRIFTSPAFMMTRFDGRTVVDVGSFIGDSSIYFALRGARRVVALEPSARFCSIARANMEVNGLAGSVQVVNEGAGMAGFSNQSEDLQDQSHESHEVLIHREWVPSAQKGVRINSLREIIARFDLGADAVLKVNCEGCEYNLIMDATVVDIGAFSEMLIEYHYGSGKLERKLSQMGFTTSRSENRLQFNRFFEDPRLEVGWLHATRHPPKALNR